MNFEDGNVFFIKTNKAFITHPVACEFSSCNSHKHKSYDDLKILREKVTFFPGSGKIPGKSVVDLALGSELVVLQANLVKYSMVKLRVLLSDGHDFCPKCRQKFWEVETKVRVTKSKLSCHFLSF